MLHLFKFFFQATDYALGGPLRSVAVPKTAAEQKVVLPHSSGRIILQQKRQLTSYRIYVHILLDKFSHHRLVSDKVDERNITDAFN